MVVDREMGQDLPKVVDDGGKFYLAGLRSSIMDETPRVTPSGAELKHLPN